jgi:nucleotide-binding universal stress UspA family protein
MFKLKNILYPINLDSKNISTVISALEIAKTFDCQMHILYVNDPGAGYHYPVDHEDAVSLKLQEIVPQDLLDSVKICYAVSKGQLGTEVVKYCREHNIDLIVTGHKHRNKLYSVLFDTPDENIIDSSNIPVLVIPRK